MNNTIENGLIVAVLFIIIFIPIYIAVRRARVKKTQKMSEAFMAIEKESGLSLDTIEQLDSFALAIDQEKQVLIKMSLIDFQAETFDLTKTGDCTFAETKQGDTIRHIELALWDKKGQPLNRIVFYQQYVDNEGSVKRTATIAAQWEVIIKAAIKPATHKAEFTKI